MNTGAMTQTAAKAFWAGLLTALAAALITATFLFAFQPLQGPRPVSECIPGIETRIEEVCAQIRSAEAAVASALWAERAFRVGSTLGALTLLAAIAAAIFARRSVRETRRIGEAQVRCYLTVAGAAARIMPDRSIQVGILVRNGGQSPALAVRWGYEARIQSGEVAESLTAPSLPPSLGFSVPANGEHRPTNYALPDVINSGQLATIFNTPESILYLTVYIKWMDVFGVETKECWSYTATLTGKAPGQSLTCELSLQGLDLAKTTEFTAFRNVGEKLDRHPTG